jgi:hypothetical protein
MCSEITTTPSPLTCLLLLPRGEPSFDDPQAAKWHQERRDLMEYLFRFAGDSVAFITLKSEVQYGGFVSDAALQIPRTIEGSDAIIADLTNADSNVMYELGFAHALKKPVLPIVRRDSPGIPSDLQGYLFYTYDDPRELAHTVRDWLYRTFRDRLGPDI